MCQQSVHSEKGQLRNAAPTNLNKFSIGRKTAAFENFKHVKMKRLLFSFSRLPYFHLDVDIL